MLCDGLKGSKDAIDLSLLLFAAWYSNPTAKLNTLNIQDAEIRRGTPRDSAIVSLASSRLLSAPLR